MKLVAKGPDYTCPNRYTFLTSDGTEVSLSASDLADNAVMQRVVFNSKIKFDRAWFLGRLVPHVVR